jgi:hypothetical protein
MPTRLNQLMGWLWLPALALLLAACSTSQAATQVTGASTTAGAPTLAAASPLAATPLPAATQPPATTAAPAATPSPAINTAPAATVTSAPAGPTATATPDPAVSAVLAYLEARARADVAAVTSLSCKAWKSKAVTEAVSFHSMNAKLVGVTCQVSGSAGGFTLVGCGGKMVTTYGAESRDWDLSVFTYQVLLEDGQWKMCGYH